MNKIVGADDYGAWNLPPPFHYGLDNHQRAKLDVERATRAYFDAFSGERDYEIMLTSETFAHYGDRGEIWRNLSPAERVRILDPIYGPELLSFERRGHRGC